MVRVQLDHGDYSRLDSEMRQRGYHTSVTARYEDESEAPRSLKLPPGQYWRGEPTSHGQMRKDAIEALQAIDELGAAVIATSGPSAYHNLMPDEP